MTDAQQVGQLFIVGADSSAPTAAQLGAIVAYRVGGVLLFDDTGGGVSGVRQVTDRLGALGGKPPGVARTIAVDQEGGHVQTLRGSGFSTIPSALEQGTLDPAELARRATVWGHELAAAGVNVNLAPVLDTVPAALGTANLAVGLYGRELGHDPATVTDHGLAVIRGMRAAGLATAIKHFPGLGRTIGNTDLSAGVSDAETSPRDPDLVPFAGGVKAGAAFVVVSLASYPKIDAARRAVFSPVVIGKLLRGDLGFSGLVMSDDLGAAAQVLDLAPGQRAIDFLTAGGTIVLAVKPAAVVGPMVSAVLARAASDPTFRALVRDDALRVVRAKEAAGLVQCG
jgi:beta-N-acetylhexosaminidase